MAALFSPSVAADADNEKWRRWCGSAVERGMRVKMCLSLGLVSHVPALHPTLTLICATSCKTEKSPHTSQSLPSLGGQVCVQG